MDPHGLVYPTGLLDALPVLHPSRTHPQNPIRALSAPQFADLHIQHTLAHPPDNALFPFLHGLEGDNHAQNTFFASSSFASSAGSGSGSGNNANSNARQHQHHHHVHDEGRANARITPKVPHYRGLVWVVCEEDLEREGDYTALRVLRRKPVVAPTTTASSSATPTAATGSAESTREDDHEPPEHELDTACAPSSSDSSTEECSDDSSSSYGEEELELVLDEDEQDMLRMLEETGEAAASLAAPLGEHESGLGSAPAGEASAVKAKVSPSTSISHLDIDQDQDEEDGEEDGDGDGDSEDSVLASPILHTSMMQVDAVHVVSPSSDGDSLVGNGIGNGDLVGDGILEGVPGITVKGKDERNFEGTHMHPVAHRPALPPPTAAAMNQNNATAANIGLPPPLPLPIGLGIDTSAAAVVSVISASASLAGLSPFSPLSSSSSSSSSSSASSISASPSIESSSPSSWTSPSISGANGGVGSSPLSKEVELALGEGEEGEALSLLELELDSHAGSPLSPLSSMVSPSHEQELVGEPLPSTISAAPTHTTTTTTTLSSTSTSTSTIKPPRPIAIVRKPTDPTKPPLLTSTFRPKELLRRVKVEKEGVKLRSLSKVKTKGLRVDVDFGGVGKGGNGNAMGLENGEATKKGEQEEDDEEEEGGWEFVPARVPDGISLRNFGIQVPIYATLSDIVVYSPYGATPAALALARRFRTAIRAKRAERLRAAGLDDFSGSVSSSGSDSSASSSSSFGPVLVDDREDQQQNQQQQQQNQNSHESEVLRRRREELLEYNVFVLDAGEEDMRKAVPHLMMRVCGAGVPGGASTGAVNASASAPAAASSVNASGSAALLEGGAHTDGPDGHVVELKELEDEEKKEMQRKKEEEGMDMIVDMDGGVDMDAMDVDEDVDHIVSMAVMGIGRAEDKQREEEEEDNELHLFPNTVDFALREREEMRDLTKASEIISLPPILGGAAGVGVSTPASSSISASASAHTTSRSQKTAAHVDSEGDMAAPVWDPRVGQVFLGNSGDVPLTPDVPSQFRHAVSVARARRDAEVARWDWKTLTSHLRGVDGLLKEYEGGLGVEDAGEEHGDDITRMPLPEDDPFNYSATNDPANGFGYDICVECHDLAPFPSTAHLRAAEEHLGMLDVMWRERWERAWAERLVRASVGNSEEEQQRIRSCPTPPTPPRPPPHANAVIHLPFPSSPANSQVTMVSLMPVVRFLEKWIQPLPLPVITPPPPPPPTQEMQAAAAARAPSPSPTPTPASAGSRRWSSVTALMPSFTSFQGAGGSSATASTNNASKVAPTPPPSTPLPPHPARMRSMTSPSSSSIAVHPPTPVQARSRPLKILLYSSDGYTESSVPALCLLMAIKSLMLPEAYLELQVEKRRSFFVYQSDLGVLRRVEGRLREEREREKEKERERERERERMAAGVYMSSSSSSTMGGSINANGKRTAGGPVVVPARGGYWSGSGASAAGISNSSSTSTSGSGSTPTAFTGRPAAKSVSFAHAPVMASAAQYSQQQHQQSQHQVSVGIASVAAATTSTLVSPSRVVSSQQSTSASQFSQKPQFEFGSLPATTPTGFTTQQPQPQPQMVGMVKGRPRASTSPWLPSLFGGDHQSWFNDPRFDGSFPSRVLPFLYLGNLNHASNVYMLHALGITHVVSVGECALVPPPHHMSMHGGGGGGASGACHRPGPNAHFVPGKGPGGHGSLWIEEREGRIKVLDIKGVCDDGIDTLEPQLEPICDWIDKARQEGGQVLVHCRVGVSRSATVTIAYVMKHLGLPLVDAYLIVRSRRLSVLIQPNMRLLYNLCGWEIKLAKERAGGDERKLKKELARTLTWPYLSKEVHALNEKYLH